jgi:hypothetical protein
MVKKSTVAILLIGISAFGVTIWFANLDSDRGHGRDRVSIVMSHNAGSSSLPSSGKTGVSVRPSSRNSEDRNLAQVKSRLSAFEAGCSGWLSPEFKTFVAETVARYPFTPELFTLIEWISAKNMKFSVIVFDDAIRSFLTKPTNLDARRNLVQSLNEKLGGRIAHTWCRYAGEGSSPEEAESLATLLEDLGWRSSLEFGRNRALAETQPLTAVKATLAWLYEASVKPRVYDELPEIIKQFPADADFAAIEQVMPLSGNVRSPSLDYARSLLFQQWGKSDPAGAANYVVSNSDRVGSEVMANVVQNFSLEHPAEAIQWIQEFPQGPYFDSAASMVILQIAQDYPDTARELAELIVDETTRSKALSEAGLSEAGNVRGLDR